MDLSHIEQFIKSYNDFPKKNILFRDVFPILTKPKLFSELINKMASCKICQDSDAIIAVDARGFIFGTAIALKLSKPLIPARKPGKLPGDLISKSYKLEYGENSLSIQKEALKAYQNYVIVDDLLATGGTVNCIGNILNEASKNICGLSVVVELKDLNARSKLQFPVESQIIY